MNKPIADGYKLFLKETMTADTIENRGIFYAGWCHALESLTKAHSCSCRAFLQVSINAASDGKNWCKETSQKESGHNHDDRETRTMHKIMD